VVTASGNSNSDACNVSPASEPTAITVGSTNRNDVRSVSTYTCNARSFCNSCVLFFFLHFLTCYL
jgi:serine protease